MFVACCTVDDVMYVCDVLSVFLRAVFTLHSPLSRFFEVLSVTPRSFAVCSFFTLVFWAAGDKQSNTNHQSPPAGARQESSRVESSGWLVAREGRVRAKGREGKGRQGKGYCRARYGYVCLREKKPDAAREFRRLCCCLVAFVFAFGWLLPWLVCFKFTSPPRNASRVSYLSASRPLLPLGRLAWPNPGVYPQ